METFVMNTLEFLKGQSIQVAIVFVAVLILTWLLQNKSAHVRYLLWLLVAIKCLTPPLVIFSVPVLPAETVPVVIPSQNPTIEQTRRVAATDQREVDGRHTASPIDLGNASVAATPPEIENPQSKIYPQGIENSSPRDRKPKIVNLVTSTGVLLSAWAAGAACYLLLALGKAVRLGMQLRRICKPLPAQLMIEQIEMLAELWNYPGGFKVWLVDGINQPFVWGLWRGAIYLPTRFQSIQGDKQKAIVLHEMAHVVRFDAFVNLIQILIQGVFWFHPLVWLANRAIRQEREKCCDEIAVARLGTAPKEYGSAIVDTLLQEVESTMTIPTLAVAGPVKNIEDRIKTIMQPGRRFFHKPSTIALLVIGVLAAFVVPTTIALTQKVTPPDYTLSGIVTDVNDKPIAGAIVFDDGYGPQPYQKGITDDSGKFEYKSWNEEHNVAAKADGYQQQMMVFTTAPFDNSKNLNFKLQPGQKQEKAAHPEPMAITFKKNTPLRDALQMLGEYYEKNIIPSDNIKGTVPVTNLYGITSVEQALQAILGQYKYVIEDNYIRVYTAEEFIERKTTSLKKALIVLKSIENTYFVTYDPDKNKNTDTVIKTLETALPQLGELEKICKSVQIEAGTLTTVYRQVIELFKQGEKEKAHVVYGMMAKSGDDLEEMIQKELELINSEEFTSQSANPNTDVEIETPSETIPVEALSVREKERLDAMNQIRQAALGCIMFAEDHVGQLPQELGQLKPYLAENNSIPLDKMELLQTGRKLSEIKDVAKTALLRMQLNNGKDGAIVAYCDGHVEYFSPERMKTQDYPNVSSELGQKTDMYGNEKKTLEAKLKSIFTACRIYHIGHGKWPESIDDLQSSEGDGPYLKPTDTDDFTQLKFVRPYVNYRQVTDPAKTHFIYDGSLLKNHKEIAVVYLDGHIEFLNPDHEELIGHLGITFYPSSPPELNMRPVKSADSKLKTNNCTATLPNGASVELVSICEAEGVKSICWAPDGTLLPKAFYAEPGDKSRQDKNGYKSYEFAIRLSRPDQTGYCWTLPKGSYAFGTNLSWDEKGRQMPPGIISYKTDQPVDQSTTLVQIGATDAPWTTAAVYKPQKGGKETYKDGDHEITFRRVYRSGDETLLQLEHNYNLIDKIIYDVHVIAITTTGQALNSKLDQAQNDLRVSNQTYSFRNLPLETVKEFQFQIRPYQWITFHNVSLRPGQKTEINIERETTAEKVRLDAMNQIKQVTLACLLFAGDHVGPLPQEMGQLKPYLAENNSITLEKIELLQAGRKLSEIKDVAATALLQIQVNDGKDGAIVAFCDGHVEYFSPERMKTNVAAMESKIQEWVNRITSLKTHNQTAFAVMPALITEDPNLALQAVQAAWPKISIPEVKQGILKAFHFNRHPHDLTVLNMGVHDPHGEVVSYALTYVADYSGVKFPGFGEDYLQWYEKNKDIASSQIQNDNNQKGNPEAGKIVQQMIDQFGQGGGRTGNWDYATRLGYLKYEPAIPALIGVIDADNSYDTIYGAGWFALTKITGVPYSPFHDGAWWRRWWEKNKSRYPEFVRNTPIPDLPKTAAGQKHIPYPEDIDTADGLIRWTKDNRETLRNNYPGWSDVARELAAIQDPKAIPFLIEEMKADSSGRLTYDLGYFGLQDLTGVPYDQSHDAKWWENWWQKNQSRFTQALKTDSQKQISPFTAVLPNGVTVELAGLYKYMEKDNPCWLADGTAMSPKFQLKKYDEFIREQRTSLVFKCSENDFNLRFIADGVNSYSTLDVQDLSGDTIPRHSAIVPKIPDDRSEISFKLGVATGQWKTLYEFDGQHNTTDQCIFASPIKTDRGCVITATGAFDFSGVRRFIAVDKDGGIHNGSWSGRGNDQRTIATGEFDNISPEQIAIYRIEYRPYRYVDFKNVSLKPDKKTDVKIEIPAITKKERVAVSNESVLSLQVEAARKLNEFAQACFLYAKDHNSILPPDLVTVKPYLESSLAEWADEHVVYLPQGDLKAIKHPSATPIAYDKEMLKNVIIKGQPRTNIVFADGHHEMMVTTDQLENEFGISLKPDTSVKLPIETQNSEPQVVGLGHGWSWIQRAVGKHYRGSIGGYSSDEAKCLEYFEQVLSWCKIGDTFILTFAFDEEQYGHTQLVPEKYRDLLPIAWTDLLQQMKQGKTVEAHGQARGLNTIVLAAPTLDQLVELIKTTKLLGFFRISSGQTAFLEFRIVPELGKDISESELQKYKESLDTLGPNGHYGNYRWIAVSPLNHSSWYNSLICHPHKNTVYVLLYDVPDKYIGVIGRWGLQKVSADTTDPKNPTILVDFDDAGASLFGQLTKQNVGRQLAVIINWKIISAPRIVSPLSKQLAITGNFTNEEIDKLAKALIQGMPSKSPKQAPVKDISKIQKPLSPLSISAGASPRVTNALKTISDLMIALDTADQKDRALSADVFNQINEQCDNLQGKNNVEMPDVAEWGKLPSRMIDILEQLHKIEETAEGCRSLVQGNYPDMLKQHWQTLKDQYNTLCLFLQPNQKAEVKAEPTNQNPQFTAVLPSGVMVELVGICQHPSKGKQWWKPDGNLLEQLPFDVEQINAKVDDWFKSEYEFAMLVHNPSGVNAAFEKFQIQDSGSTGIGSFNLGNRSHVDWFITSLPRNLSQTDLKINIGEYWIEFKNISLKPGKKTDVKIEIQAELKTDKTYDEAFRKAIEVIDKRESWPRTPEAVVEVYWNARAKKDYNETRILWPGSSLWDVQIFQKDADIKYVVGPVSKEGTEVPYAEENYYKQTGSYNLTMRLSTLNTQHGKRYYIWSGN